MTISAPVSCMGIPLVRCKLDCTIAWAHGWARRAAAPVFARTAGVTMSVTPGPLAPLGCPDGLVIRPGGARRAVLQYSSGSIGPGALQYAHPGERSRQPCCGTASTPRVGRAARHLII